jgi:hypothetical protein
MYIAAIGIDRYSKWNRLHNAVQDARGALDAFIKLGFETVQEPLLDQAATGEAIRKLVVDELRTLGTDDSLVVFFAGHGHTETTEFARGNPAKTGYIIPYDGDLPGGHRATWLPLGAWLRDIAHLRAQHVLVILDSCHSGVALDPVARYRASGATGLTESLEQLHTRRSRRIITSALEDQVALDSGPLHGHSLFTGCLIEALRGNMPVREGRSIVTGSDIGIHVQRRVTAYPDSKQTPDFGALELDDRGELIIDLAPSSGAGPGPLEPQVSVDSWLPAGDPPQAPSVLSKRPTGPHEIGSGGKRVLPVVPPIAGPAVLRSKSASAAAPAQAPAGAAALRSESAGAAAPAQPPAGVAALRSESAGAAVPAPQPGQSPGSQPPGSGSTFAYPREFAVMPVSPHTAAAVQSSGNETTIDSSRATPQGIQSAGTPPRALPPRRDRPTIDAAFAAALDRHDNGRRAGEAVLSIVAAEPTTAVTGWAAWAASHGRLTLVTRNTTFETATAELLDQTPWLRLLPAARACLARTARLDEQAVDRELDARSTSDREAWIDDVVGHDLAARVSGWLLSSLRTRWAGAPELTSAPARGAELLSVLGKLAAPIAVLLHHPDPSATWLEAALRTAGDIAACLPRHAVAINAPGALVTQVLRDATRSAGVAMARQVPLTTRPPIAREPARDHLAARLHSALERDPRTAGRFTGNATVPTHDRERLEVALLDADAMLVIEIDSWYWFRDPRSYERDRTKDTWLARAGYFVMRFLAEDVEDRIAPIVNEVALGLAGHRAAGSTMENPND